MNLVNNTDISEEFYYLGCVNSFGESETIANIRQMFKDGFHITAFDLNPHCYINPARVYVEGREYEAFEALIEHVTINKESKIAGFVLQEITGETNGYHEFTVAMDGKLYAPPEDWILAWGRVKTIEQIATRPTTATVTQ